jgi:hypothetical protein
MHQNRIYPLPSSSANFHTVAVKFFLLLLFHNVWLTGIKSACNRILYLSRIFHNINTKCTPKFHTGSSVVSVVVSYCLVGKEERISMEQKRIHKALIYEQVMFYL